MTDTTPSAPPQAKTPIWKKRWFWITIGALLVIGILANIFGDDDNSEAAPEPTQPTVERTETPTPKSEPEKVAEGPSDDERAAAFEQAIKDAFGGEEFSALFAADPTMWAGWINGVRIDGANAYVTLQVEPGDPEGKALGERAASALSTLLPADAVEGVSWIIVEDASGVVIDQKQPAPIN